MFKFNQPKIYTITEKKALEIVADRKANGYKSKYQEHEYDMARGFLEALYKFKPLVQLLSAIAQDGDVRAQSGMKYYHNFIKGEKSE